MIEVRYKKKSLTLLTHTTLKLHGSIVYLTGMKDPKSQVPKTTYLILH